MSRRVLFFFLAWICYCGRALECSPLVYLEHSHRLRAQVLGDSPEDLAQVRFAFVNNASVLPFSAPRYLSSVSKYVAQLELSPSDACEWLECSSDGYTLALTGSYGAHEALECNITREVRVPRYEFELYWVGDAWDNLNQSCRVQVLLESALYDRYARARVPLDSGLPNMRERGEASEPQQQQQHWVLSLNVSDSSHSIALEFRERASRLAFARNLSLSTLHRTCSQKQGEESFSPGFRVECDIYEDHASRARRSRNVFVDGEYIYTACRLDEPPERTGRYQLGVEDILMWSAEPDALFSLMADRERHYLGFEELERERHDEFVGRWRARPVTDPREPLNLEFRWSVMPTRARSTDDAHTLRYRGEHLSLHMICNSSATYSPATRRCETHPLEEEQHRDHQMSKELALFVALVMLMFISFLIVFGLCI